MRTSLPLLLLLPLVAALASAGACVFDAGPPANARIRCAGDAECPPRWFCQADGACVEDAARDTQPPALADAALDRAIARRGDVVLATFIVDDDLLVDPVVRVQDRTLALRDDQTDRGARTWAFAYAVAGDEPEGEAVPVVTDLVDKAGNVARGVFVGSVSFDLRVPACGDHVVDTDLGEACDDGNLVATDACLPTCEANVCGDGLVNAGVEACDDGNLNPNDGCDACSRTSWSAALLLGRGIEGGSGSQANLFAPFGVDVDILDRVFIADTSNNRVCRVDPDGTFTVVAGTGAPGSGGDGGPATEAQLSSPMSVSVDGLGRIFIADFNNARIRVVDANGIIDTVAGVGGCCGSSGDGGAARAAHLGPPLGVRVDGLGRVFISEGQNSNEIRVVGSYGIITRFAGGNGRGRNGDGGAAIAAQLSFPGAVCFDGAGGVLIPDSQNGRVRRVDALGVIRTIAGRGGALVPDGDGAPATAASVPAPSGCAVSGAGDIYIADEGGQQIRMIDALGIISTVAGSGALGFSPDGTVATAAAFSQPISVALDRAGRVLFSDTFNGRIRRVEADGTLGTAAGAGTAAFPADGAPALSAPIGDVIGIAGGANGAVFVVDSGTQRVIRIDADGLLSTVAQTGPTSQPHGVAVDLEGRALVSDTRAGVVSRLESDGSLHVIAGGGSSVADGILATDAQLIFPQQIAVDANDGIVIVEPNRIRRVDATSGLITTLAGTGVAGYGGDGGPATAALLDTPMDVAVDGQDRVLIADMYNHRVRRIEPNGTIITVAGTGVNGILGDNGPATSAAVASPNGVAADPSDASGAFVIATVLYIRRVDGNGIITTVSGNGSLGFDGDGGPAVAASFDGINDMAIDGVGDLLVGSFRRARRVGAGGTGTVTSVAGAVDPPSMGAFDHAQLAEPQALVRAGDLMLFAGGVSGRVFRGARAAAVLDVVVGWPLAAPGAPDARHAPLFANAAGIALDDAGDRAWISDRARHVIQVLDLVDRADASTWTLASFAGDETEPAHADGALAAARFDEPTGLFFDAAARQLYVADTGNHVIRRIDVDGSTVSTVAGTPRTLGDFGDGGAAAAALLFAPQAVTTTLDGSLLIADTGNNKVRRVAADGTITTIVGDGTPASSGDGAPSRIFPVDTPLGMAVDRFGNLFVTSRATLREVAANGAGVLDGQGAVSTIYGALPRDTFPETVTHCLTGVAVIDDAHIDAIDSCAGYLLELVRQ